MAQVVIVEYIHNRKYLPASILWHLTDCATLAIKVIIQLSTLSMVSFLQFCFFKSTSASNRFIESGKSYMYVYIYIFIYIYTYIYTCYFTYRQLEMSLLFREHSPILKPIFFGVVALIIPPVDSPFGQGQLGQVQLRNRSRPVEIYVHVSDFRCWIGCSKMITLTPKCDMLVKKDTC